ncbi:type I-U CRISPR-associated helicase/endonuclease Cas3 [Dactylosporangium aurantiacum]|uniref:Type I-U CRISPR-associated helicase/endonuclease Cas3 n=1 Tax=Dactylosporangium aurantiacum TaxID=35754 RepID=A0A9Q9IK79_9ACTN|nr:type I-U CRISPR-associated helicase/endonuclease Cas3 [Dactylosporangium aurantiacum]MDG6100494.1 type I-U CRISPR-associated helicase/endonuclease Cas3 [Dactylosporangium aurantiacum]UWZ55402.1 type I-U CRISPR-associated helicase/endonuclease Cas3 [Dactylosporangium aurantiacum]
MSLDRADFGAFFAEVHGGHRPFRWQLRLLDHVLDTGCWPDQIVAPTGAGKTSVIDVHVFAVALMAAGHGRRVPRRLALVVDRRALVDDQYDHAEQVAGRLRDARGRDDVLGRVAAALDLLRWSGGEPKGAPILPPLRTVKLRGGAPPPRSWRDDPIGCTVICATPDMWGSRLLLAGYGSRREARPREAGLLAYDTVAVVDEAHLSQQLVITARRVAELAAVADEPLAVPVLQVVETTATPSADAGVTVGVEPDDLNADELLQQRLTTPKPVGLIPLQAWPIPRSGAAQTTGIQVLVDEAVRLRQTYGPTVGCFVNTVAVAVAVTHELRSRGMQTELICGRLRPHDVAALRHRRPGLLNLTGNSSVDVLVSTQTLEVGADLDLAAAVTELASGGALAQRAGRVNRLGQRKTEVSVVAPATDLPDKMNDSPYRSSDLTAAHEWLRERCADPRGLAPWALRDSRPPSREPTRDLFQRLELGQIWHLARTSDDLAAEPDDLDLWLSDDLSEDHEIGLVVRRMLPDDPADAIRLIQALPPRPYEVFPVRIQSVVTTRMLDLKVPAVLVRPGDPLRTFEGERLRPGDQLVVDDTAELFTAGVLTADGTGQVSDVLHDIDPPQIGQVVLRIERDTEAGRRLLDAAEALLDEQGDLSPADLARLLHDHATELKPAPMVRAAAALLDSSADGPADAGITVHRLLSDPGAGLTRLIVVDLRKAAADDELRQSWSRHRRRVTLQNHAADVAERAAVTATRLGLGAQLIEIMRLAGLHHDDGKSDPRFQRSLGADPRTMEPLAKSGTVNVQWMRRLRDASGLPTGWRHEQLSAVHAWRALSGQDAVQRDLAVRLVGTSHGRGRHGFPHPSRHLLPEPDDVAAELFDEGIWDELIERTHAHWGVWGCAYLEAVLRAADGQISAEGR